MKQSSRILAFALLALLPAGPAALADVKMPAIFGDHMVLQTGLPLPVWGTADPGEAVTVTLGSNSAKTTAGPDGKWQLKLPAMPIAAPLTMTVTGKNTLTFSDVLIGEVWVCSGQSNMQFATSLAHDSGTEIPNANDPQIRLFVVSQKTAHLPVTDLVGAWKLCTPQSVVDFSAVGYFFGRELRQKLNRPVGLIGTYWGGTPAQAWTSLDGLKQEPALAHFVDAWNKIDAGYQQALAAYPAARAAYDAALADWKAKYQKDSMAAMRQWQDASAKATLAGQTPPPRPNLPVRMPVKPTGPDGGQDAPATLYNGMIAPLQPYAIRGVIWYQGESNAGDASEYHTLFARMIKDWRQKWSQDFPFLWVQLAGFHADDTEKWPTVRQAQLDTLSLPKTGMATAIDIGLPTNIHPMDKLDVGKRLALAALHVAYGQSLVYSGPIFQSAKKEASAVRVQFHDFGSPIAIGQPPWVGPGAVAPPADHLVGFELSGPDGKWLPADAKIDGQSLLVTTPAIPAPVAVRYDWKSYPTGNLYDKEGLPASPFKASAE